MVSKADKNKARLKRHTRVRSKISGTAECPRLNVFRSNTNIYAQIIDDVNSVTLVAASSLELEGNGGNKEAAFKVGEAIAKKLLTKASPRLFLTAVDTSITAVSRNWPKALVRAASSSNKGGINFGYY